MIQVPVLVLDVRFLLHILIIIVFFIRDGRQLEESVSKTLGWIQGELGELAGRLLVSADKEKLRQQLERHGPAYREAMAKEHEVIMLLNKGKTLTLFG